MAKQAKTKTMTPKLLYADKPQMSEALRPWGDLLCLWRLCAKPACARSHACKGDARRCFPRHFHLLPQGVKGWFEGVGAFQKDGAAFDNAMACLDQTQMGAAFRDWHAAVSKSLGEKKTLPERWWTIDQSP